MHNERLLGRLPETYATALRLRERGLNERAIAAELSVEPEAVRALLGLAEAKLAALLARTDDHR
jgi:DNA-directed RNA polymerase specialized sigma24 family protein